MDLGIKNKVAFVAGGSKGMGKSAARMLAEAGCRVGIVAQSWNSINEAVAAIRDAGGIATGISADLTSESGVKHAVSELRNAYDGISPEIVVSQTNDMHLGHFDESTDDDFLTAFQTFTMAQVYLMREVLPEMKRRRWGRICHIGSVAGKEADFRVPHITHNTARPSTAAFLRTIANEVAPYGITVNTAAPAWFATPTLENYLRDKLGIAADKADEWMKGLSEVPMNRLGRPDEIGSLVAYLCSQLAGYITGEWIAVDGGRHKFTF